MLHGEIVTTIARCCISLFLACTTVSANVCIFDPVSVSQIRGRANYIVRPGAEEEPADKVSVQLWKTDRTGRRVQITAGETDSTGHFSFPKIDEKNII
jgi:hypothetical protein